MIAHLSVWKQRNAALVRMVLRERQVNAKQKKKFWTLEFRCQDFASSPAEGASIYRVECLLCHKTTFIIISQWALKLEIAGGVAIAERGAQTDHMIAGGDL